MKTALSFLVAVGLFACTATAFAQINVNIRTVRTDYMMYEPLRLEVAITNYGARPVKLEDKDGKPWLHMMVTRPAGEMAAEREKINTEPLTLRGGETVVQRFNLTELFRIEDAARYAVQVKVIDPAGKDVLAGQRKFFVGNGVTLWEETVGVLVVPKEDKDAKDAKDSKDAPPSKDDKPPKDAKDSNATDAKDNKDAKNAAAAGKPEPKPIPPLSSRFTFSRKYGAPPKPKDDEPQIPANAVEQFRTYSLLKFTIEGDSNFLYIRIEDKNSGIIYGVFSVGKYLPFFKPQARVDRNKVCHILFQSSSRLYTYIRVTPEGGVADSFDLTNYMSPPNLVKSDDGKVVVSGGERTDQR